MPAAALVPRRSFSDLATSGPAVIVTDHDGLAWRRRAFDAAMANPIPADFTRLLAEHDGGTLP